MKEVADAIRRFVDELTELTRREALRAATAALAGDPRARVPGRPNLRPKPEGSLDAQILATLSRGGHMRTEVLSKSVGVPSARLRPVLRKLVDAGRIERSGAKRGTSYAAI